jgi:hypothetical protein
MKRPVPSIPVEAFTSGADVRNLMEAVPLNRVIREEADESRDVRRLIG